MTPLDHALAYAALGWRIAPVPPGYKYPFGLDRWQELATTDPDRLHRYWAQNPDHGMCIATGPGSGIVAIDIDTYHGGEESWRELLARLGVEEVETVEAVTGGGGRHLLYAHPNDGGPVITNAAHALPPGVDVRGDGGQIVVAPTIHPTTGARYEWEVAHDPLDGYPVADMPAWLAELLRTPAPAQEARRERGVYAGGDSIVDRFNAEHTWPELLEPRGWTFHSARNDTAGRFELWTRPGKEPREGASASLYYLGSDVLKVFTSSAAPLVGGETYTRFGFWAALEHGGDHSAAGREARLKINAIAASPKPTTTKAPTLVTTIEPLADADQDADPAIPGQHPFSDLGNARRLVDDHGHDLRYAPQLGTWLAWDGRRWAEDVTGEADRRAKAVVDGFYTQLATLAGEESRKKLAAHWMRSQAAPRLEAMVRLARTEPGVPVTVAELDADPWLLNTETGAIDLRTGEITCGERRLLVTKLASITVDPAAQCPTWRWFLDWAMRGDEQLVGFLQRAVGYSLTGSVGEQCLFFLHGSGENGKSTFLNVLQRLAGDYALAAEADLLLATTHERHSTGIADLVGRRLVVVQETDDGRRLAEATVKQLTGGDTIRARRMRQDNFEFRPTHKLWMAANHRPMVRGTDHGIWRRIRMVPFEAAVAPGERDPGLLDRLLTELPGILNWALEGARQWLADGLRPPDAVLQATQEYRTEQDHVGRFVADICTLAPTVCVSAKDLRTAYEAWCEENGERAWSAKAMAPQLVDRGCERVQAGRSKAWTWVGITIAERPEEADAAMMMSRLAKANGPRSNADVEDAACAAHSEWAASETDVPGAMQKRGPCGLSPGYPHVRAHTGEEPEEGPQGPRYDDEGLF